MEEHATKHPGQLSGGQQQRVAIARALSMDPEIMLFDEPTSALDPEMVGEVLDVMVKLAREGMTMLVVTHEMGFARAVADWVVFMDRGRVIEKSRTAEFFARPTSERARTFLSSLSSPAAARDHGVAGNVQASASLGEIVRGEGAQRAGQHWPSEQASAMARSVHISRAQSVKGDDA
jgi:ABC-type methionine transport system ATPase subunit